MENVAKTEKRGAKKAKGGPIQVILNVLGVILCVIFVPIIIINVMMIIRSYTQPDKMPSVFGYSPVIVLSQSMSPEFDAGDMIFIRETDPDTLQVNDVICYLEEETAITHRIMEIQEQDGEKLFITMGDANGIEDTYPVVAEQIQGKYLGVHLRGVGQFAMFLQTTPGMLIFIGGPVLLFFLWDLLRRMVANRHQQKAQKVLDAQDSDRKQEMEAMEQELQRLRAQVQEAKPSEEPQGEENPET